MKKAFTIFFVTLGVIFFLLILGGVYLYVADPLNLRPLLSGVTIETNQSSEMNEEALSEESAATTSESERDTNTRLSPAQQSALETVGIDAASLPTEITAEQEACFVELLGAERVAEIQAGDTPTAREFFTARGCLE